MKLPKIFKDDIQSNNIQLIPLLVIERDDNWSDWSYNSTSIFLSTHDLHIDKAETGVPGAGNSDGIYFSPLLLDSPIITEKLDIETRKYNISKCKFKISNNPYNGQRFSDMLNTDSLIGKRINFAYKSINSSLPVGSMYLDQTAASSWADIYDNNEYVSPTFYFGEIRDVVHTNEILTITAEDLSSSYLHQELPKKSLPVYESIEKPYRGEPIPMVYGYVPQAPLVMGKNKKIYADSKPISGFFQDDNNSPRRYGYPFGGQAGFDDSIKNHGSLFISIDDNFCIVPNNINVSMHKTLEVAPTLGSGTEMFTNEHKQVGYLDDDEYDTKIAKLEITPLLSKRMLQVFSVYKPGKISLERRNDLSTWENDPEFERSLGDGDGDWGGDTDVDSYGNSTGGDQLTEGEFEKMTDGNFESGYLDAESDTSMSQRSEAMINLIGSPGQIEHNRYKHSLFRFVIDIEPPIRYHSRGGISDDFFWISFGHWVMPRQWFSDTADTHNYYTSAEYEQNVNSSYYRIVQRYYTYLDVTGEYTFQGNKFYRHYTPNGLAPHGGHPVTPMPMLDDWGRETQFADIVRFSDYHNHPTYGGINPTQINWHNVPGGNTLDKSPLEFFGLETVDETGNDNYDKQYVAPYAKFTSHSKSGEYHVHLGAYGWRNSLTNDSDSTDQFMNAPDLSYNFDYRGRLKGWLPEITCMSVCDVFTNFQDLYGSVIGRVDGNNNLITHPADIISDIFVNELGHSADKIDQDTLNNCKTLHGHSAWKFAFSQAEVIDSKELIEDIAKSTFIFPRINFDGVLKFPSFKRQYSESDWTSSILIKSEDIISYSYNLTRRSDLSSGIKLKFDYDHQADEYLGDENTTPNSENNVISETMTYNTVYDIEYASMTDEQQEFYGITEPDDNIKEVESKYIRSSNDGVSPTFESNEYQHTAKKFVEHFAINYYKHRHLIIKCKLPIKYLNIEIGDYIIFDSLIDNVKAYGIDYTRFVDVNGQSKYPMFMCIFIKKSIESVELQCIQLPHLYNSISGGEDFSFWYSIRPETIDEVYAESDVVSVPVVSGCTNPIAENYNPDATLDDGSCTFAAGYYGCTDPEALNYNPEAVFDNGSCFYQGEPPDIEEDEPNATELILSEYGSNNPYFAYFRFTSFDGLDTFPYSLPYTAGICYLLNLYLENDSGMFLIPTISDPEGGLNKLFPITSFYADFGSGWEALTSWNQIIHPSWGATSTTPHTYLEVMHTNAGGEPGQSTPLNHHYYYNLQNTNSTTGQPQQLEWVFTPPSATSSTSVHYEENGYIIACASIHNPFGQNNWKLKNWTEYPIKYVPPHPMYASSAEESPPGNGTEFFQSNVLGDVNGDGIVDITDLVSMINLIMTYEDTSLIIQAAPQVDVNNDGVLDILDVITLINIIVEE